MQVFFSGSDYRRYLDLLAERCALHGLVVWTYCLMPNHVHLVAVPESPQGLARPIAEAHQIYAWRMNSANGWTGHLWQQRFASFPMDETHLYFAVRYVLLNPVRAGLVSRPEDWRYSSVATHLHGRSDPLVDPRPMAERIDDWAGYLAVHESDDVVSLLRKHSRSGRYLGRPSQCLELKAPA